MAGRRNAGQPGGADRQHGDDPGGVVHAARLSLPPRVLSSGRPALDVLLGGGWPAGVLIELLVREHCEAGLGLLLPVLAAVGRSGDAAGPHTGLRIFFIDPPLIPCGATLVRAGVDVSRLLLVRPRQSHDLPWSMEQVLASGACALVLAWAGRLDDTALRRLQRAAARRDCWAWLVRAATWRRAASPAALRVEVGCTAQGGLELNLFRNRFGPPGRCQDPATAGGGAG